MDIAEAQKRFSRIGTLHRLDLKLRAGVDHNRFVSVLSTLLPAGTVVAAPEDEAQRSAGMARAYRTNLDMLALVALFTGAFLVFSTQFLSLIRRRTQLALLRVLGVTRGGLLWLLMLEGVVVGVLGSALGVALGCVLARIGLATFGGDLGAGYFRSTTPALHIDTLALIGFFALGVTYAAFGAALPALEAARRAPALALKAGDEEEALRGLRRVWPSLLLIVIGLILSQLPAMYELPIAGYAAVATILLGAILFMPRLAEAALRHAPYMRYPPAALAIAQLQATPRQVGVSLAAILASFSLMVAMLIMVGSFRTSLEAWLDQMLPADLYVRAGRAGDSAAFTPDQQSRIATLPGIAASVFIRSHSVFMRADRPPLSLHARVVPNGQREPALPYTGRTLAIDANAPPPAWISEVAADLLAVKMGAVIELPLAGVLHRFTVAGIWRDYARQNGAIAIERERYIQITGDASANEVALHLERGASLAEISARLRAAFSDGSGIEIASTRELKATSLAIFERTFAVTYALEVAAVLIGMFGVSASFSAQALARRRELGVLRHLGMTRRQVAAMLGCEGCIVGSLGVIAGLATGWIISLILIHVINRQSFHWSMDLTVPWTELALLAAALVAAAATTAVLSGRRAMSDEVTRAVREDW
jgi:putative ABC transport system permease protein